MKKVSVFLFLFFLELMLLQAGCCRAPGKEKFVSMNRSRNNLTPEEELVIVRKGTERPFSGKYNDFFNAGVYICRRCGALLYRSEDKFKTTCGWPGFDDEFPGAVRRVPDADGKRTEITCARCGAHLGHVFTGEHLTPKNVRHCVNSVSLEFVPAAKFAERKTAYFAGGCFWGVEYLFEQKNGVYYAESGYMGGRLEKPTYKDVCSGKTGHYETVKIVYNPGKITYEELVKYFFENHDPEQADGQGPDKGEQYKSVIFTSDDKELEICRKRMKVLEDNGIHPLTQILPVFRFWKAEDYHQNYYSKNGRRGLRGD